MGLIGDIGKGPVALDTPAFVYWIEEHPSYAALLEPLFRAIDGGKIGGVTSGVTLLEVLVQPLRAGDLDLAARYEALLSRGRGLAVVDLDRPLLRAAAQLRAAYAGLRTPDALQIAAALSKRARALVTNDRHFPSVPGLRVLQLRDYLRREE